MAVDSRISGAGARSLGERLMTDVRKLVVCLDGTNNEPEHGATNVARIYDAAHKTDDSSSGLRGYPLG
jgi:uncharacterized protein (DUF2235 family)